MRSNLFLYSRRAGISASLILAVCTVSGATIAWNNTGGGAWSNPANWSPNLVPGFFDSVQITAAGTYTVTVDTNVTITSLTLGGASGVQTLTNYNQTVAITNGSVVAANGVLDLGGGTLSGGPMTLQGTLNWAGATVNLPLTVTTSGVLNFSGSSSSIEGPLMNAGTINWSGVSSSLTVYNNHGIYTGMIYNQATGVFNIQNDSILNSAGYGLENFVNAGTVQKTAGVATTTFGLSFTNYGMLSAQSGAIRFTGGGNLSGTYNIASGATITFDSGSFTQSGPVTVTGNGVCKQNGATVTLDQRITRFILASGSVQISTTFQGSGTIQNLQLDGATLVGTNVVTGTLGINGGGLGSASPLTVANGGVLNFNGAPVSLYSPLTNLGTINWSGGGLTLYNNNALYTAIFYNQPSGVLNAQNDQNLSSGGYGFEAFSNAGTVRKTAGLLATTFALPFTNAGTIDAESGTIRFTGGGNVFGTYNTAAGGLVEFGGGSFAQSGAVTVSGAGLCRLNGATLTLNDRIAGLLLIGGNVALAPNFQVGGTIQNLQLDGATLVGTNVVTGTLGINGGGLGSASPLTVAVGGVLNFNGAAVYVYAPLTNLGTINWSGLGLSVYNNSALYTGIINNQPSGLFNIQTDQTLATGGYGFELFYNNGTIRKTAGLGTTTINVSFINTGTLDAQSGILRFAGPYSQTGGVMNFGITSLAFYGQIAFSAIAPLTGTLSANFNGGYSPSVGDSFTLLNYGSRSGIFTGLALPAATQWQTNYNATTFTLAVLAVNTNALAGVKLTPISYAAGHFTLQVTGILGPDYVILASTNLSTWTGISTSTPSVMPFTFIDTNAGAFPHRFYRALLGP
jgi:hypothetical protein